MEMALYIIVIKMKSISSLLRSRPSIDDACRKTYGNVNMAVRKQLRRLKKINIYHRDISGESNPNSWMTPKRLKAMVSQLQTRRNMHPGSAPSVPEVQKQLLKIMPEMSDYQYFLFRNREIQKIEQQEFLKTANVDEFISQLPAKFRKEVLSTEPNSYPEIAQPALKYSEQLQIFLPQDERHRYNLMQKIMFPPATKTSEEQN